MTKTIWSSLFAIIFLHVPTQSLAQNERSLRRIERLSEHLALSEEQIQEVESIFATMESACSGDLDIEDSRRCMQEQRSALEESIEAVLSSDQLEELQSLREEFGACRPPQGGGVPALQDELELSDEQVVEVRELMASSYANCAEETTDTRRECLRSQQADIETELAEILTAEQVAALDSLRSQRGGAARGANQPGLAGETEGDVGRRPPPPPRGEPS
jgi:Spy/CpxP family protein refolding chaperone